MGTSFPSWSIRACSLSRRCVTRLNGLNKCSEQSGKLRNVLSPKLFGMTLHPNRESQPGRFDCFDNPIVGASRNYKFVRYIEHGLMVKAINFYLCGAESSRQ